MFERPHLQLIADRIQEPRRFIQVIMGPRQVGKTTLVGQLMRAGISPMEYHAANAVPASDVAWIEQVWNLARLKLTQSGDPSMVLIIDEIQKVQGWSEIVKKLWDEDTGNKTDLKVILLGSSRMLMQQGLTESLAGRFESLYLPHWSLKEMEDAFGLSPDEYVWFGGYPGSVPLMTDEPRWKSYIRESLIETAISKDIFQMTRVDKPALLRNLFELGSLYSGQVVSYTKILGQLHDAGNTTTLSHYLKLLHTAGLLGSLEKFAVKPLRRRASIPKFQVHNTALLSARSPATFSEARDNPAGWGRIVESAAGAHLINMAQSENFSVYYWREGDYEVDFVLEMHGKIIALEVKSNITRQNTGINRFHRHFNPHKTYLVGGNGIPLDEFLRMNPMELL